MAQKRTVRGHGRGTSEDSALADSQEGAHNGSAAAEQPQAEEVAPTMQRAEELVDRMAERIGHYSGVFGHKILWLSARAREEAEDIWAEAQAMRQQKRQQSADTDNADSA